MILNISAYVFVTLDDTERLRAQIHAQASAHHLKGTVLLASEGINLFLAGAAESVHEFIDGLRTDPRFAALQPKESVSGSAPFKKLLVKVKPEIIRMNTGGKVWPVAPQTGRAPAVSAATLERWLAAGHDDEGRPVVTLDTRNAFEVDHGQFDGAMDWRLQKFSDFPEALARHKASLQDKTVVSYCTGGIRCEKAALLMRDQGLDHVYQLEGGILKYFEDTAAPFWRGDCFVFDERRTLDASLRASPAVVPTTPVSEPP